MAVDWSLVYRCEPKDVLGGGKLFEGTMALVARLKATSRAEAVVQTVRKVGGSPEGKKVVLRQANADGTVEDREVVYEDMVAEAEQLLPLAPACVDCPANVLDRAFGCTGVVHYPIAQKVEQWLADHLEPPESLGGRLFAAAVRDLGLSGEPMRQFRAAKLFESGLPVATAVLGVTTDSLFQAMFGFEEPLNPAHCLGVLLWLGCLTLDDEPIERPEQAAALNRIEGAEARSERTSFGVDDGDDPGVVSELADLLTAMYYSWVLDVPLWVSA